MSLELKKKRSKGPICFGGEDNPIDSIVLKVLIRKVREIQRATGVSIHMGEQGESIMDSVLKEVLLGQKTDANAQQNVQYLPRNISRKELEAARGKSGNPSLYFRSRKCRSKEEIKRGKTLLEIDEAIGDFTDG